MTCQQHGANDSGTPDSDPPPVVPMETAGEDDTDRDEKDIFNKNSGLEVAGAGFSPQQDRRIFTDFEAAGLPRREMQRLAHALHESVSAGRHTVSLGLRTPKLGELRFDVRIMGKVVLIHAFVDSEQASTALALAVSSLRDMLEERNLVLGRLDVTVRGNADSRGEKRARESGGKRRRHKERSGPLPSLACVDRDLDATESRGTSGT